MRDMREATDRVRADHLRQQTEDPTYWERDKAAQAVAKQTPAHGPMHYIAGAAKAVVASVTADSPMSERRLAICKGCDQWDGSRCKQCGCFTGLKVRLPAEACPIGKWHAEG
jgi:hypothetical protein